MSTHIVGLLDGDWVGRKPVCVLHYVCTLESYYCFNLRMISYKKTDIEAIAFIPVYCYTFYIYVRNKLFYQKLIGVLNEKRCKHLF